jgi:glycosyltransferase involved in cell wall biosynthesis
MKKVNLALISPNKNAYSETFIANHKNNIDANITYLFGGSLPEMSEDGEFAVHYNFFNKVRRRLSRQLFPEQLNFHEKRLVRYLKKRNIDMVLAEFGMTGVAMLKVCRHLNLPLIVFFHGVDAYLHETLTFHEKDYKRMFREASFIFAVSKHMYDQLISLGCPSEKLAINTYGPADFFYEANSNYSRKNFLAIGRFVEKKAPHYTIQAFANALKKHPDAKLRMVGDGRLRPACEQLVKDLNIENSVEFKGILNPQEILTLYADSLAFVQHSLTAANGDREGTPVAVLEAGAGALPVIATLHAGIPDVVVDGETGFLFEEGDIEAMSAAMIKILDDFSLARRLGTAARQRIRENFTLEKHIKHIDNVIEGLSNK